MAYQRRCHLGPCLGRTDLILFVFLQVRALRVVSMVFDQLFEKAPPAGFEPAHTAPECVSVRAFYLRKRRYRLPLGGVWGAGFRLRG